MTDQRSKEVIEIRERHAISLATDDELQHAVEKARHARNEARSPFRFNVEFDANAPECASAWAAAAAATNSSTAVHFVLKTVGCLIPDNRKVRQLEEEAVLCDLLRDIFGNPFRPVTVNPSWLTNTVLALASQMYESRDFSPMPILADVLQDAGCDNEDILRHCRQAGEHVRGCWVIDRLLGKE